MGDDACDGGRLAGFRHHHLVAPRHRARGDGAAKAAEVEIRPVDELHGQAERLVGVDAVDRYRFEVFEQRRAAIPAGVGRRRGDVVAIARRHRDRRDRLEAEVARKGLVLRRDPVEDGPVVADQVDLVDRHHDMADAEQRGDEGVPPRLPDDAGARVDEHDGEIGRRGAGRHVAGVLLVAGRVGDDELALRRGEEAVGDVDGDALLALGLQPVDEQREIDVVAGRAVLPRVLFERGQLVLEDQLGVVEQASDQRRLAVVDGSAGEEAQERLALLLGDIAVQVAGRPGCRDDVVHQKYPSRFFFSIEPASSRSISRPCRSEVRATSISWTMSSSV